MKKILLLSCTLLISLVVIAQIPVAYFPFSGNANDAIGTNNGTVNGAILTNDRFGNANSAYSFDGINDVIQTLNTATSSSDNWTMMAWVKPASISQVQSCIVLNGFDNGGTGNGFSMIMSDGAGGSGNVLTGLFSGFALHNSGGIFSTNNIWYHVVMLRQAGTVKYYLNGVQTSNTYTGAVNAPIGSIYIGAQTGVRFWNGAIDEVKIYNVALTAAEVLQEYNASSTNLVSYYPFNGNANDAIGTNHGTVKSATLTTDRFGNPNSAYNFPGTIASISLANALNFQFNEYSYSAWVKTNSLTTYAQPIITIGSESTNQGFSLVNISTTLGNQTWQFYSYLAGSSPAFIEVPSPNNTEWHHVVGTRSTNELKLYVDGVLIGSAPTGGFAPAYNTPTLALIGSRSANTQLFNGIIDEVKIYNSVLTLSQVQQEFASSNQAQKPGSGSAMSFNGSTQSIAFPNSSSFNFGTADFSVDFWYNSLVSKEEIIFDKRDDNCADGQNWAIRKNLAGEVFFEVNVPGPSSDFVVIPAVSDGKWHHIAFIRAATQISAFKDGMLTDSKAAVAQNVNNSSNFRLGTGPCSPFLAGGGFFSGNLDEIKLWNIALTQSQIRERMCKKITNTDPLYGNLVAYYNFNEASGNTAFDGTVNAQNGTLTNSPTRVTSGAAIGNASSHDYVNATKTTGLTHPTGESFTVTSTSGSPAGIQVYRVDEQPNSLTSASGVGINNKYFGVFQAGGTTPQYTAVYNYNGNPLVTPSIESQLRLNKRTDNAAAGWTTMSAIPDETNNSITVTGESTEYILGRLGGILPLNLLSFIASKQQSNALLQWKTANEVNVLRFEVQRSENGFDFASIGSVTAGGSIYSFSDINTFNSRTIVFYRLKSIDADGKFTYSGIVRLSKQESGKLAIFPNPVNDILTVSGLKQNGMLLLFNAEGKLLLQQTVTAQSTSVNMAVYAKGTYWLQYENDGIKQLHKIVKM